MVTSLETLRKQVITCKKCDLCKTRKNAVPGKGKSKAEVIFIGEAPGRFEDIKGEPFVGVAGKQLSEALEKAGLSRKEVYITNIVKCRPPGNRIPNQKEKESCKKYLDSEIELVNPKIICLMGNTAFRSILGGNSISKNRGRFIKKNGFLYFLTIHPAAIMYNRKFVESLRNDMKKLVKKLSEIKKV